MLSKNQGTKFSIFHSSNAWLIVCCGMLFYCYNYFLRVSPSVFQSELTQAFHITASEFGVLAGLYYYSYTFMQIPAGLLYDKFGVRFILASSILTAVFGLIIFINAENYYMAGIGRLLIGLGCASAYIGTLKLAAIWLSENLFATVAGLTTTMGMTSGALAQIYLSYISEQGYQSALKTILIFGITVSILIILFVRNHSKNPLHKHSQLTSPLTIFQIVHALKILISNKQMWLIGLIGCLLYLPSSVFLDLWGIPYLEVVYKLQPDQAVHTVNFIFYGWIISGPIIGIFSDKIKRRKPVLIMSTLIASCLVSIIFYGPVTSSSQLILLCFLLGLSCGAHPLCFAIAKENNPIQISGTSLALTNMLIMSGGAIFQPFVGYLLDFHNTHLFLNKHNLPIYTMNDYTFALSILPIGLFISILLSLFLKETYGESQASLADEKIFKKVALQVE